MHEVCYVSDKPLGEGQSVPIDISHQLRLTDNRSNGE